MPGKDAWVVHINSCFQSDIDFDRPSYQNDWADTIADPKADQKIHSEPVLFTSPTTVGGHNYPTIAFETDPAADRINVQPHHRRRPRGAVEVIEPR